MLSKTCGYAIRGLVYLALKSREQRNVGLQELARELAVPPHFMGKVMQDLARRAIIGSAKGPNGGFFLNDSSLQTPLLTVIDAVDGLGAFRRCLLGLPDCSAEKPCPLHHEVVGFRHSLYEKLKTSTVEDLAADVETGVSVLMQATSGFGSL